LQRRIGLRDLTNRCSTLMAKHPGVPTVPLALTPVETKALNDPTNVARFSRAARIFPSTRKFELDPTKVKIQRTSVELPNLAILPFSKECLNKSFAGAHGDDSVTRAGSGRG